MELTGPRSDKCQGQKLVYLLIGAYLPLLSFGKPFLSCNRLQFEYQHPGNSSVSLYLCVDVCPPMKSSANNIHFCCRNCPEYCIRCLNVSSTNPPELSEASSFQPHRVRSSPASLEISTNVISSSFDTSHLLLKQLETYRQEEAKWQMKEIVYIAVISCLVFVLTVFSAAFLLWYKLEFNSLRESTSMSSSEVTDTTSEERRLLDDQQLDRKMPVEDDVKCSSLCALQQSVSLEAQEDSIADQVNGHRDNTAPKEIETSSQNRRPLMSIPHTLHEDSWNQSTKVTDCTPYPEQSALQ